MIVSPILLTEETSVGLDGNEVIHGDMTGEGAKGPHQTAARL
jgi:hypothetical protein